MSSQVAQGDDISLASPQRSPILAMTQRNQHEQEMAARRLNAAEQAARRYLLCP